MPDTEKGWHSLECALMAKMMMSKKSMPHSDKAAKVAKRGVEKKAADDKGKKKKGKLPPWLMYDENGKVVPKKKGKK